MPGAVPSVRDHPGLAPVALSSPLERGAVFSIQDHPGHVLGSFPPFFSNNWHADEGINEGEFAGDSCEPCLREGADAGNSSYLPETNGPVLPLRWGAEGSGIVSEGMASFS